MFNAETLKIGKSIMIDGIMITCQPRGQPTLAFNPEERDWPEASRPLAKEKLGWLLQVAEHCKEISGSLSQPVGMCITQNQD